MQRQRGRNGVQVYSAKVLEWHEGGGIGGQLSAGAQKKEKEEGHGQGRRVSPQKKKGTLLERAHLLIQTNVSRPQGQSCYKSQEGLELMGEWLRTSGSGSPHLSLPRASLSPRLKKTLTTREAARTRSDSTSERGARAATCHCSILDSGRLMGAGPDAHHPQITAF